MTTTNNQPSDPEFKYQTLPDGTKAPICPDCNHAGDLNAHGYCQTESYHRELGDWQPCRHKCNVPSVATPSLATAIERVKALEIPDSTRDGHPLSDAGYNRALEDVLAVLDRLEKGEG